MLRELTPARPSLLRQILLMAGRELSVGFRSRAFAIGMIFSSLVVSALAIVPGLLGLGEESSSRVAVVGGVSSSVLGELPGVDVVSVDDVSEAEEDLAEGAVDAVVDLRESPAVVAISSVSDEALAASLAVTIDTRLLQDAAGSAGVTLPAGTEIDVRGEASGATFAAVVLAYIVSLLLFTQLAGLGASVAQGTMEEKTTRVIDVLFPRIRPIALLVGKVLGIGLFGLVQLAIIGAVGLGAVTVADIPGLPGSTIVDSVVASLVWFALGFLVLGFVYGAVSSMARRPESLSTLLLPLQLLNGVVFVVAVLALQAIDSGWVRTMSLIPPFSAILMPMRQAVGDVPALDIGIAVAAILVAASLAASVGGAVYRRAITGSASVRTVVERATEPDRAASKPDRVAAR